MTVCLPIWERWRSVIIPDNISHLCHFLDWGELWVPRAQRMEFHVQCSVSLWGWCCAGSTPRLSNHGKNCSYVPFLVGSIVWQDIFLATCQRSRLCEELATSAQPTCCNWKCKRYLTCRRKWTSIDAVCFGWADLEFHLSLLGPPWHFQHENYSHYLKFCSKVPRPVLSYFSLLHNALGQSVDEKCTGGRFQLVVTVKCCVVIKRMSQVEESHNMVDLGVWKGEFRMTADIRATDVLCSSWCWQDGTGTDRGHCSVCGELVMTIDMSLSQTKLVDVWNWWRGQLLVDCHLIYLSFMDCRAFALSSSVFFFCKMLLTFSLLEMPEVHLKENWRKSPSWYKTSWRTMPTSDRGGRTGALQTPWPMMRHQVRVKESKELKVVEERNLKCSRSAWT